MIGEAGVTKQVNSEMEQTAAQRAKYRANAARWNLEIAIFLFAVLILVLLLINYTRAGLGLVTFTSVFGLAMVWLVGWRQGRQLYQRFYNEEIFNLKREAGKKVEETMEETVEEKVQKALRERWK